MHFSVLMSVYKNEKKENLDECFLSLSLQETPPTEIVLVIDGPISTELENSIYIWVEKIDLIIVKSEKNLGLGHALNKGIEYCNYSLIFRMDTDDICEPTRFSKQIEFLKQNSNISLLGSATEEFNEDMLNSFGYRINPTEHNDIVNYAKKRNPFNHMTVAFRKEVIIAVGGYQHHLFMEDYNLWIRVISAGYKVANLPDVLVKVRAGNSMVSRRKGFEYIKSEFKLARLKIKTNLDSPLSAYSIFFLRSVPRLLPTLFLFKIYKVLRKK
ncbi:glycosyltransferase [Proteus vulgaris]|uniref:glycosyltransferase n=1 Tax=Proteus vulgaris TaxID=585 RepID=UPI0035256EA8